jgi:hypothetical protein
MFSAVSDANVQATSQQGYQISAMENLFAQGTALINAESSAVDVVKSLNIHAASLLDIEGRALEAIQNLNSAVEVLNRRMLAIGELQLVDFCFLRPVSLRFQCPGVVC